MNERQIFAAWCVNHNLPPMSSDDMSVLIELGEGWSVAEILESRGWKKQRLSNVCSRLRQAIDLPPAVRGLNSEGPEDLRQWVANGLWLDNLYTVLMHEDDCDQPTCVALNEEWQRICRNSNR